MPAHDVFISYSSHDERIARIVLGKLQDRGVRCFFGPFNIGSGQIFTDALAAALESSRIILLVYSEQALVSPWVKRAVVHAVSKGASVLVFRLEQVVPPSGLEFVLSISQWLDALPPPVEAHLNRLVGAVESLLGVRTERRTNRPAASELPDDVVTELMKREDVRLFMKASSKTIAIKKLQCDKESEFPLAFKLAVQEAGMQHR